MVIKASSKKKLSNHSVTDVKNTTTPKIENKCTSGCKGMNSIYKPKNNVKNNVKTNVYESSTNHSSKFVIFSIDGCNYCLNAKKLLADMKLNHHIIDVPSNKKNFYKTAHNMTTFPQIFYHTRNNVVIKIGGYDELDTLLKIIKDLL